MSERPGGKTGPQGGETAEGKDFSWLYGKTPRPTDSPDATRMLPVQPRPTSGAARGATPPTPRPPAPTPVAPPTGPPQRPGTTYGGAGGASDGIGGGWLARRLRRPRFYVRTVLLVVLLFVVYTVAVPFVTWTKVEEIAFAPDGERPAKQPGTTYLLVGNDSRRDLSPEERRRLSTGNATSELTDTIMLLHTGDGPNLLLSVPRDSFVDLPGYGESKINSAYARGGPQLLVGALEAATGIRIDQYVEIGLGGVADVVDAVGGITVCPRERMVDPQAGLNIRKGCREVDGRTALAYSRSRKVSALGDLDRVRRQREVIAAVGDKVLSPWTVLNPVRWWRLNAAVPSFFGFGEGMGKVQAGKWALAMTRTTGEAGRTCTMPVTSTSANYWDMDRAGPLFSAIIEDRTDDVTNAQCSPSGIVGAR